MTGAGATPVLPRSAAARAAGLMIVWVVLSGGGSVDLVPGVVAALAATGISLWLLPPGKGRLRLTALAAFAVRFVGQSVIAGADVARRALDPRMPLNPAFVRYPAGFPRGPARNAFTALTSLLPGTVPIAPDESDALIIHCLDVGQPVSEQLALEEARLARVMGVTAGDG
jgi:multicomponent Na+:H+ antiporter subunit E